MLDDSDAETLKNIRYLLTEARDAHRPLLIWIGAGAGRWAGYPGWEDLAVSLHRWFASNIVAYDKRRGLEAIDDKKYPALFELCQHADTNAYRRQLIGCLSGKRPTPVFERLARELGRISPLRVITTNVDQSLEHSVRILDVVQRSDVERVLTLLGSDGSFMLKLHGCISSINSLVMTSSDYTRVSEEIGFRDKIRAIASACTILFLGYGLQDRYIIDALNDAQEFNPIFGAGPHFVVLPSDGVLPCSSTRPIRYHAEPHRDHRCAVLVVSELANDAAERRVFSNPKVQQGELPGGAAAGRISAHLLWDVYPPGTWETSVTVEIVSDDGSSRRQALIGNGFSQEELLSANSSAMHEFVVALICYDYIYASIYAAGRIHSMLGGEVFWQIVAEGTLRFISWEHQEAVLFPSTNSIGDGDLGSFAVFDRDKSPLATRDLVSRQFRTEQGKEAEMSRLFDLLADKTRIIRANEEGPVPRMARGVLVQPSIRKLLRISEGMPTNAIPRWYAFPVLRLANVMKTGEASRLCGIASVKLDYGAAGLVGPALSYSQVESWADRAAEYVLAGRWGEDLGFFVSRDPNILSTILRFRTSQPGIDLRREVFKSLATNDGQEIEAAINGALRAAMPESILQSSRDALLQAYAPSVSSSLPLLWNNRYNAEDGLKRWALRSRRMLEQECERSGITDYDLCPCRSGEKLKFCCKDALRA